MNKAQNAITIAICATDNTKDSLVSPRYARSNYFAIYNTSTSAYTFVENDAKKEASGASNKATKILGTHHVDVLLAPKVGPKAFDILNAFNIKVYQYEGHERIEEALNAYLEGRYHAITDANAKGHQ
ncbi:MAG: NifB/NifX family molybdenum-iron cluster-binding protein [Bacillota bacterium]